MQRIIFYDCEIARAIPIKGQAPIEGISYCDGWGDIHNMGIACICALDSTDGSAHVFCEDNLSSFQAILDTTDILIGFNSHRFDNKLLAANELVVPHSVESYDLLEAVWKGSGAVDFKGLGLDAIAKRNLGFGKSGNGAIAPVEWQQGKYGSVINYCLDDCRILKRLCEMAFINGSLEDPRFPNAKTIPVAKPKSLRDFRIIRYGVVGDIEPPPLEFVED